VFLFLVSFHVSQVLDGASRSYFDYIFPFDVLLTVHLSIFISVFNQLDAQNLFYGKFYFTPLHVSSTYADHQGFKIALHSLWYHHTYRCDDTRGCVMQFWPPCASGWLNTKINIPCLFMTTDMYCFLRINSSFCIKIATANVSDVFWRLGCRVCALILTAAVDLTDGRWYVYGWRFRFISLNRTKFRNLY